MTIAARDKQRVLDRLFKLRTKGLNPGVLRAIFGYINPELGVASAKFCHYAEKSGRSERVVQRTVRVACNYLILRRAYREGAPAIWCPELMGMEPEEAVRRVDAEVGAYNKAKTATPTSSEAPTPPPADPNDPTAGTTADNATAASTANSADQFSASKTTPETASKTAPLNPKGVNSRIFEFGNPSCAAPPPRGGGAWRAKTRLPPASSKAHDLVVQIGKLCGLGNETWKWSEHWRRHAPGIVQCWLTDQGWYEDHIICVVRDVIKKKGKDWEPPEYIRYFERPITRFYAQLAAQIAEVAKSQSGLRRE